MRARQLLPSEIFERDLVPLLATGCRVARVCGGDEDSLLDTVEQAARTACQVDRDADGPGVMFLRLVVAACVRRSPQAPGRTWRTLPETPADALEALPVSARAALALDLAESFPPEAIARILGCSSDEAEGLRLMAEDAFGLARPRPVRAARRSPCRVTRGLQLLQ